MRSRRRGRVALPYFMGVQRQRGSKELNTKFALWEANAWAANRPSRDWPPAGRRVVRYGGLAIPLNPPLNTAMVVRILSSTILRSDLARFGQGRALCFCYTLGFMIPEIRFEIFFVRKTHARQELSVSHTKD
jgi:hypothetical protein